jgi:hypothetical protein
MLITDYNTEEITNKIASGMSLRAVAREMDIDPTYLGRILDRDDTARLQYARAIVLRSKTHAEEIIEIADEKNVDKIDSTEWNAQQRLRVDARKWTTSKFAPELFGDKLNLLGKVEHVGLAALLSGISSESDK